MSIPAPSYGGFPNPESRSLKHVLDFFASIAIGMNYVCQLDMLMQDL